MVKLGLRMSDLEATKKKKWAMRRSNSRSDEVLWILGSTLSTAEARFMGAFGEEPIIIMDFTNQPKSKEE
jgi:hypothetical protein